MLDSVLITRDNQPMGLDRTRSPAVVRQGKAAASSLGSSGRGQLKIFNRPDCDAGYALIESSHPVGEPRIRDHVHARHEETFLDLEVAYQVRLGDGIVVANTGDYVFVRRDTPHTYRNVGPAQATMHSIISPADGINLLIELGALSAPGFGTNDELVALHARDSTVLVEPLTNW